MINVIAIVPLLWGMGLLALSVILYGLLGIWGLAIMVVIALGGIFIGIRIMKTAGKKDKTERYRENRGEELK